MCLHSFEMILRNEWMMMHLLVWKTLQGEVDRIKFTSEYIEFEVPVK